MGIPGRQLIFVNILYLIIMSTAFGGEKTITMTDIDGNKYNTVKIGSQIWTLENLKVTRYNDGTKITQVEDSKTWDANNENSQGAFCWFDFNKENGEKYGLMYNWYVVNTGKLAPKGWHIPSDDEWKQLEEFLISNGYNYDGTKEENRIAKSLAVKDGWLPSDEEGAIGNNPEKNNRSGFSALPGGQCTEDGKFYGFEKNSFWWSTTEAGPENAYIRGINYKLFHLDRFAALNNAGCYIRLVKDK